ncbi:MAG: zinc-ribbon domain-containing protein [Desulfuromonadaceae bacterium]|nr:zinc-ribbon domain-containing protein [Desulfuromonadaceae bacterium]
MKISCPKCNASGTIPDHEVPESGRFISCPRCKEGFTVNKPSSGDNACLVNTCPSCGFGTFDDETFGTCPKCGVMIKMFVERQREEHLLQRNQKLLGKKLNNVEIAPQSTTDTVADFIDNLHPVNLISWGVAVVAICLIGTGLWGVISYDSAGIQALLGEEKTSGFHVFLHYGLLHWVKLLYGLTALAVSILFMKRLKLALEAMSGLLWATIVLVPLSYTIGFIYWALAPIPHTISGYLIEIFNVLFMSALVGVPLYLLERYLHERKITSFITL